MSNKVLSIINEQREESFIDKTKRLFGAGNQLSHWLITVVIDGHVEPLNLLKFESGLKLFVEEVGENRVTLSTIRPIEYVGQLGNFEVRMDHWKYGRTK